MIAANVIYILMALALIFPNFLTALEDKISPEKSVTNHVGQTNISLNPYLVRNKRLDKYVTGYTTDNFIRRHIRKGNCFGIKQGQNDYHSFKTDLERTAQNVFGFERRTEQTYILSTEKSPETLGKCIWEYVARNMGKDVGEFYHRISLADLETLCGMSNIYIAYITDINWAYEPPTITCQCGSADFVVGFKIDNYKKSVKYRVHHFHQTFGFDELDYNYRWNEHKWKLRGLYNQLNNISIARRNQALIDHPQQDWGQLVHLKCY